MRKKQKPHNLNDVIHMKRLIAKAAASFQKEAIYIREEALIEKYFQYMFTAGFERGLGKNRKGKTVYQLKKGMYVAKYESVLAASRVMGVSESTMRRALRKGNEVKGSTFTFKKEGEGNGKTSPSA